MRHVRPLTGLAAIVVAATSFFGCISKESRSPVYLVIDTLEAQAGGSGGSFGVPLGSDVWTKVTSPAPCTATAPCYSVFSDIGRATLRVELKSANSLTDPTPINDVTIKRYRVVYRRISGPNVEGVDVPFTFDGATTGTVRVGASSTLPFEVVSITAKETAPLVNLLASGNIIATIAEVTFWGVDEGGNEISVSGLLQVDFADFFPY